MISDKFRSIIKAAIADVEARLNIGPPGFQALPNGKPEFLPAFFEGMQSFDSGSFPEKLQQYIVAFSAIPVATFVPKTGVKYARKFDTEYLHDPDVPKQYKHFGFSLRDLFFGSLDFEGIFKSNRMAPIYNTLVNAKSLSQLEVPAAFTSLQLYAFFKDRTTVEKDIIASARRMLERTLDAVDSLEDDQRTRDNIDQTLCRMMGLPVNSVTARDLNEAWAINQRVGIYENENDQKAAAAFFDILQNSGIDDQYYLQFAIYHRLNENGMPDLTTPGAVPRVMVRVLGSYYHEIMTNYRAGIKPAKFLAVKPASPERIVPGNTVGTDVA